MVIRAVNLNDGAYLQNGVSMPVKSVVQNDSSRIATDTVFVIPPNRDNGTTRSGDILQQRTQENISKHGGNNFFLIQPTNQTNPFYLDSGPLPPAKGLLLFGHAETSSASNPFSTANKARIQVHKTDPTDNVVMCAAEALPPFRRISSLRNKLDNGDYLPALGLSSLALINLPEDLRDIRTAAQQIHSFTKGEKYVGAYTYKEFQHEFSFFRGTMLQWLVDLKNTKNVARAEKLLSWDKSILRTSFGQKIKDLLNVEISERQDVKSFNRKTKTWELAKDLNGDQRYAYSFKGSHFGKLMAKTMARTTLIGTACLALLELPKIFKASTKGDNLEEKAKNMTNQTVKSTLNVVLTTIGIGAGGAIGSKYFKGLGSIVGMGTGAVLASKISQKLQDLI